MKKRVTLYAIGTEEKEEEKGKEKTVAREEK